MTSYRTRLRRMKWRMTRAPLDDTRINGKEGSISTAFEGASRGLDLFFLRFYIAMNIASLPVNLCRHHSVLGLPQPQRSSFTSGSPSSTFICPPHVPPSSSQCSSTCATTTNPRLISTELTFMVFSPLEFSFCSHRRPPFVFFVNYCNIVFVSTCN